MTSGVIRVNYSMPYWIFDLDLRRSNVPSSRLGTRRPGLSVRLHRPEELSDHVALETAHDLPFGPGLGHITVLRSLGLVGRHGSTGGAAGTG